jgi:hypothetical protein
VNKYLVAKATRAALRGKFNPMIRGVGGWGNSRREFIHPGWRVMVGKDGVRVLFVFSTLLPYKLQDEYGRELIRNKMLDALKKYHAVLSENNLVADFLNLEDGRPYLAIVATRSGADGLPEDARRD